MGSGAHVVALPVDDERPCRLERLLEPVLRVRHLGGAGCQPNCSAHYVVAETFRQVEVVEGQARFLDAQARVVDVDEAPEHRPLLVRKEADPEEPGGAAVEVDPREEPGFGPRPVVRVGRVQPLVDVDEPGGGVTHRSSFARAFTPEKI